MIYDLCEKQNIPYRNTKKWVLAQTSEQYEGLVETHDFAKSIGVPTRFIPLSEAHTREPDVRINYAVLESPSTGIVDSHSYMSYLESDFRSRGGDIACHTSVESVEPIDSGNGGWKIGTKAPSSSEIDSITAEVLINSAGLAAVPLSNTILPRSRHLTPYFAKGSYYSYSAQTPRPKTLIYPAPTTGAAGLGTHLTMDMTGAIRFGPDVEWVDDPRDLSVNESRLPAALDEIAAYLPGIQKEKVQLDYSGMRPKLGKGGAVWKAGGEGFEDFVIRKEEGFEGFVNLLGIESPGLTSSLAIAEMVDELLYK
jgi:2-hydroxyglutarate dehydrogenase